MRKIPTTMATQHPDNAGSPFWQKKPFISSSAEIEECFLSFSDLGIDEYNWDWEGKFVDEAVVDRLLHKHYQYFKKHPLGSNKFLTFRIPNPRVEKQFRLARAYMVAITSSQLSQSLGFGKPPIFEMILPLTETAEEIIDLQEAFQGLVGVEHKLLKMEESIKNIEIIPLFEQVDKIMESGSIIRKYFSLHKKSFGKLPKYLRPYCARSDPALNSGIVPTILALKVALSDYIRLEKETGVKLFPMLGTGTLPFRGNISPLNIDEALNEYAGVSTLILQSAFRYDFPKAAVKNAVAKLEKQLQHKRAKLLSPAEIKNIQKLIPFFEVPYKKTIEALAPIINSISRKFPRRRERVQHVGLFGYSRGIGKVKLPRAITFTGSLYSLGIPPELIGSGRGLREAKKLGLLNILFSNYVNLKSDIEKAGYFLNKENLKLLATQVAGCNDIADDIKLLEEVLNIELGPQKPAHFEHYDLTQKIYKRLKNKKDFSELISKAGILRKSLG